MGAYIGPVKAECVAGDGEDAAEEAERIFEEMGI